MLAVGLLAISDPVAIVTVSLTPQQ